MIIIFDVLNKITRALDCSFIKHKCMFFQIDSSIKLTNNNFFRIMAVNFIDEVMSFLHESIKNLEIKQARNEKA